MRKYGDVKIVAGVYLTAQNAKGVTSYNIGPLLVPEQEALVAARLDECVKSF